MDTECYFMLEQQFYHQTAKSKEKIYEGANAEDTLKFQVTVHNSWALCSLCPSCPKLCVGLEMYKRSHMGREGKNKSLKNVLEK